MACRRVSLIDLYPHSEFNSNPTNFADGRTLRPALLGRLGGFELIAKFIQNNATRVQVKT